MTSSRATGHFDVQVLQFWLRDLDVYAFICKRYEYCMSEWHRLYGRYSDHETGPLKKAREPKVLAATWRAEAKRTRAELRHDYRTRVVSGVAQFLLRHGLDPLVCLRAWSDMRDSRKQAGHLSSIFRSVHLPAYIAAQAAENELCQSSLQSQAICMQREVSFLQHSSRGIKGKASWRYCLADETNELSPLFRFCISSGEAIYDLAERYAIDAAQQYCLRQPGYDRYWASVLPTTFTRIVKDAYRVAKDRSDTCKRRPKTS